MSFLKRVGGRSSASSTELRPWGVNAILRSISKRAGNEADETQVWQCASAPRFVLMFRSRRREGRRSAGRI